MYVSDYRWYNALARRSLLFLQVELLYEPTVASGNIVSVCGSGTREKPWIATISVNSTAGIVVGKMLSATAGSGAIYGVKKSDSPQEYKVSSPASVLVTSVVPDTSITFQVIGGTDGDVFQDQMPVIGSISDIVGYYEHPLPVVKYSLSSA
jgi:hypothetical protein